ncbi:MAG: sialidase family protein [Chloroflexota bacterium]
MVVLIFTLLVELPLARPAPLPDPDRRPQNCGSTVGPPLQPPTFDLQPSTFNLQPSFPFTQTWSTNVRVNDDSGAAVQDNPTAVWHGLVGCACWFDERLGNGDIFFAHSDDGGLTWTPNVRVNDDKGNALQMNPSLAVNLVGDAFVVWRDDRNGQPDIYFSRSLNGGATWSPNVRVNDVAAGSQTSPALVVDSAGILYVLWVDDRNGHWDIYSSSSSDNGQNWSAGVRVNDDLGTAAQYQPTIALSRDGDTVYAAWRDERGPSADVYFARSTNGGVTWSANVRVNDDVGLTVQERPTLAGGDDDKVYLAWTDRRNGQADIFFSLSTDGGSTWGANVQVNDDGGVAAQNFPSLDVDEVGRLYLAWSDSRQGNRDIYAATSTDDGLSWSGNIKVNDDGGTAVQDHPGLAVDSGVVHVIWADERNLNSDIYTSRAVPLLPHP